MRSTINPPTVLLGLFVLSSSIQAMIGEAQISPTRAVLESFPLVTRDPNNPNNDNTCGPVSGRICDPIKPGGGWCCSSYGYCGNGKLYCGKGCQKNFGICETGPTKDRLPKVKFCGSKHKNQKCDSGFCCSSNGLCGNTPSFCGKHCQKGFGHCGAADRNPSTTKSPDSVKPIQKEKEERCGLDHGAHVCGNGQCCSHAGYCGIGKVFCAVPQNCQRLFGRCNSDATPDGISTAEDPRQLVGKISYDLPISQCKVPKTIALTFDDGPSENTQQLLDILAKAGAKATFFVSGNTKGRGQIDKVDKWVDAIKRMSADGHQIASHTWSHPHMDTLKPQIRKEEMYKNERALANIIGKYPSYMRAPYIECSANSGCMADMKALGYHVVSWGVDSSDWQHENDLNAMVRAVDEGFQNAPEDGHMLLIQHDTIPKSSLELTKHVLKRVAEKGWKAVTLSECLGEPADFAYQYPARIDAGHMAEKACFVADGKSCGQLDRFENKEQCFHSNKRCQQQLFKQFFSKQASAGYRRFHDLCEQQFLFCAQCGHSAFPACSKSKFTFDGRR